MKVRELRVKAGMSVEEFAVEIGSSSRTVSYWEANDKGIYDTGILRPFKRGMQKLEAKVKRNAS